MAKSTRRSASSRGSRSGAGQQQTEIDLTGRHPALIKAVSEAFALCAPPPNLTVSQWADEYRQISAGTSPEPGRWRTDRVPYMREIMDAFNDPTVREIAVMKGTQVAYTEAILNTIGYLIDFDPCPILWLLPNDKAVDEISKNRLTPMLRDTPRLASKVKPPRSRDSANTIAAKQFPGGRLSIVGSNSPSDLASRPIRVVIEDECDRFAVSAGAEGDPSTLVSKRQAWFWNAKTIKGSSPTIKGRSKIARAYEASDKRMLFVPCPHCGERQTLRWEQVKWDKEADANGKKSVHRPETAYYQCEYCGALWDDGERWAAIGKGNWQATAPFRGIAGFFLPQFYSTVLKLSQMVTEFLTAYGKLPGTAPSHDLQIIFTNTVLAECWEETGDTVDASQLSSRGEPYGPQDLPDSVVFATCGVDVQKNRIEAQIIGWGYSEEVWAAEYHTIPGDPTQLSVWEELDRLLLAPMRTTSGRPVRILATCIDSGDTQFGHQVHEFCRPRFARRVFAIKGDDGKRPIFPKSPSKTKTGHNVYIVGTDTAKDTIYNRLLIRRRTDADSQPGFIHFPLPDVAAGKWTPDYFAQLTSEQAVTRYRDGRPYRVWIPISSAVRNEALDTFVYALAARQAVGVSLARRLPQPLPDDAAVVPEAVTQAVPAKPMTTQNLSIPAVRTQPPSRQGGKMTFMQRLAARQR